MVGVEHTRDPAHLPAGVGFTPDAVAQRQRGVDRRGRLQAERIAGHGAGVVVLDHTQPRPGRLGRGRDDPQVQFGVVGLPDLVRSRSLASVHQIEHLLVALGALVGQRRQTRVEPSDDGVHRGIGGPRPALPAGQLDHLAVDGRRRGRWSAQRHPLDQRHQLIRQRPLPLVGAGSTGQTGQPSGPVASQPPLHGAQRQLGLTRERGHRHLVFQVWAQQRPAGHR